MKRAFDIALSLCGLAFLWPLLLIIGLVIVVADGFPVVFRQKRVGYRGRLFAIRKFRTMVRDAELRGALLTVGRDSRVTRVGFWLRKLKLDELPQLFNVLLGEMSFVGPRPEVPKYVDQYTVEQRRVLDLVPGITDPASIRFRHESDILESSSSPEKKYIEDIMPQKIRLNLGYAARCNVFTDLLVILRTVASLVR